MDNVTNGQPARIRFDRNDPAKTLSLATVETMLMEWRARNPAQFGYWLATAELGTEPSKSARAVGR